jgi:chitinase
LLPEQAKTCTVQSPVVANPGGGFTVDEQTVATLDGSGSSGPAGVVLTGQWIQVSGPPVQLEGVDGGSLVVSFRTPEVKGDTPLGFELQVRAGAIVSSPAPLAVTVRNVNQPPLVGAAGPERVDAGVTVALVAIAVDPDDQPVSLTWSQSAGPAVVLSATNMAQVTFTAPAVTQDTVLGFAVLASDGVASASAVVQVTVLGPPVVVPPVPPAPTGCGCQGAGSEGLAFLAGLVGLAWATRRRRGTTRSTGPGVA